MSSRSSKITLALFVVCASVYPVFASAHQPRIVETEDVTIVQPEISKAYYGVLSGKPHIFHIESAEAFDLYVNILVPDIAGQQNDVSAIIMKHNTPAPLAVLGGVNGTWKPYFEEFGHDNYLQGAEYKAHVAAGEYEITLLSPNNESKYALAVGETEFFDMREGINALAIIPGLKRNFFNESPASFILSPFGIGYIVALYILAALFGLLYRTMLRRVARRASSTSSRTLGKNIDHRGRLVRAAIGFVLLVLAITTSWSPFLLFVSGFSFFEAIFSWCGLYAAIGKSTCPVD